VNNEKTATIATRTEQATVAALFPPFKPKPTIAHANAIKSATGAAEILVIENTHTTKRSSVNFKYENLRISDTRIAKIANTTAKSNASA
jgi:hypothetical protein